MFSAVLIQYIQSRSIIFTIQNTCFIYIPCLFTVTAFHKALIVKFIYFIIFYNLLTFYLHLSSFSLKIVSTLFNPTEFNG